MKTHAKILEPQRTQRLFSAADPLNLVGVLFPGARVPSSAGARLRFRDGLPVSPTEAALCA